MKRNVFYMAGALLALGLLAGCPNPAGDGGGGNTTNTDDTTNTGDTGDSGQDAASAPPVSISGEQVYTMTMTEGFGGRYEYAPAAGSGSVTLLLTLPDGSDNVIRAAAGSLTGGKLTLSLPGNMAGKTQPVSNMPSGLTVSPGDAQMAFTSDFEVEIDGLPYRMFYANPPVTVQVGVQEIVYYWYSDRQATIKGGYTTDYSTITWTNNYNITLRQGWNPVYMKQVFTYGYGADLSNETYTFSTDWSNINRSGWKWVMSGSWEEIGYSLNGNTLTFDGVDYTADGPVNGLLGRWKRANSTVEYLEITDDRITFYHYNGRGYTYEYGYRIVNGKLYQVTVGASRPVA
jgi:hypothetical protein